MENRGELVIAEFTIEHPILREPLRRVPGIEARWGLTQDQVDGPTQMTVWIAADDFEAVDEALEADPGTTNPTVLAVQGDRRLYRVDFTELGRETNILQSVVENGGAARYGLGTKEGWNIQIEFPNREGVELLYKFCRDHDIAITFHRIFEQTEWPTGTTPKLTTAQEETLIEAADSGYLEVPRECSLAELGDRLGVSGTATSERFRRGAKNLIEATLSR